MPLALVPKTPEPLELFDPVTAALPEDKPVTPRRAVMAPALKLPVPSRLTMAFAVLRLVGATFQISASVPLFVTGEPPTLKSSEGALSPTLVTVPVPGNVCPETNVTLPVWSTLKEVPLMANAESVPLGNRVSVSRTSLLPLTSSVAAGAVVPMPMSELFWKIMELMMSLVESHMGTKSSVPLPVTAGFAGGAAFFAGLDGADGGFALPPLPWVLLANTKADGGSPPMVSASAALRA